MAGRLSEPCRIKNRVCRAGAFPGRQAFRTLPFFLFSLFGRCSPWPQESFSYPAGMRIMLVWQELSLGNKFLIPCRIENKASINVSD